MRRDGWTRLERFYILAVLGVVVVLLVLQLLVTGRP